MRSIEIPAKNIVAVMQAQHERIVELEHLITRVFQYLDTFVSEGQGWSGLAVANTVRNILKDEA